MKLFLYDQHHERILTEMDIPDGANLDLLNEIVDWLEANKVTDNYKKLIIANSYRIVIDEGLRTVEFD
jgi:hypothetical protein